MLQLMENRTQAPLYKLTMKVTRRATILKMRFYTPFYTTSSLPQVAPMLQQLLPSIFFCSCYNDLHQSFEQELLSTELGHLYEHILLEVIAALNRGSNNSRQYCGVTSWNWNKDIPGTFHIRINVGQHDEPVLREAVMQSCLLMDQILAGEVSCPLMGK